MSYCRFGWGGSRVYVYESAQGFECCGCWLNDSGFTVKEPEEMIAHLGAHRRAGHFVPDSAVLGLWEDIPGAQRSAGEDPAFTKASLKMDIIRMQIKLKSMEEEAI